MSKGEKAVAIAAVLFTAAVYAAMVYAAIVFSPMDRGLQKWQSAGEECIRVLDHVCQKEKNSPRKVISSKECQLLYEDFSLFGVFECRRKKLYADIWVGKIYFSVKNEEATWSWVK
jgi:hypothetical protein